MQALDNIRIVLVETSHPGNIGAAARAMKTMGLSQLVLVRPRFFPHEEATALASGAVDVLENARICDSLADAVADCHTVVGTTARQRTVAAPVGRPSEIIPGFYALARTYPVALVFGRERTGLLNQELDLCRQGIEIPANPEYSSLNLAAAVQVLGYELRCRALQDSGPDSGEHENGDPPATTAQLEGLYAHLERVLIGTGFVDPGNPRFLMRRLRRLFSRAGLDQREVNILRGILTSVEDPHPPAEGKTGDRKRQT